MSFIGKLLAGLVGGFAFAFIGYMVIILPLGGNEALVGPILFGLWALALVIAFKAKRAAKAWRRLLIGCAVFSLMLPLSALIFSGVQVAEIGAEGSGAATAGAVAGGGIVTVMTGFVSFFMAAIFLLVGLLIGRDKPESS